MLLDTGSSVVSRLTTTARYDRGTVTIHEIVDGVPKVLRVIIPPQSLIAGA
jgi:hypothetical protein